MHTKTQKQRAHPIAGFTLLVGAALAQIGSPTAHAALSSAGTIAVPTYEAAGLYWQSPGGTAGCQVQYRKASETTLRAGLDLWYDARDQQCRGSLVNLEPDTDYYAELNLPGQAAARSITFRTWANQKPVAKTIAVAGGSATFDVAESGTPTGYVVYDGGGATLDGQNNAQYNVTINASYVIVRNLKLTGAKQDAIRISPNVHDVIIEDNEITNWGRTRDGKWGVDMDSAIRAVCVNQELVRVTIQRNRIHDPRYSANSWSDGHPAGPQGITLSYCGGNHVIRHNEITGSAGHYYNDVMGGEDNFSTNGFPNADSDIYGNTLSHAWDDGIEAEGANENIRIWGNYIDRTAIGIANTVTSIGPSYVFRNVWNRAQMYEKLASLDQDDRQPFFKEGTDATLGYGRRYFFHNTMLQATQSGLQYGLGGGYGMGGTGSAQLIQNTVSMNNIYHLWKPGKGATYQVGTTNTFANDLYSGTAGEASIANGIAGIPVYAAGSGWQSESGGMYQLASTSPGYGRGRAIANFNDGVAAPDVGAHQSGTAAMKFGVAGSPGSAVGGAGTTISPTPIPAPTPSPTPAPTPTTSGVTASATALYGFKATRTQSVTFTNNTGAKVTFLQARMSNGRFQQSNNCGEVAAGGSCKVTITYYPSNSSPSTGTFTLTSTAPNSPNTVALSADAAPTPTPTPAPTPPTNDPVTVNGITQTVQWVQFGSGMPTVQYVKFTNNSTAKVTFWQAYTDSAKFGSSTDCGDVAVGASCTATLTYWPTNSGASTGTFNLTSNVGASKVDLKS